MGDKREECTYMARLSEQTERWEDMVEYMKKVIDMTKDLSNEERNLLSIAYKNTVGQRRTAWRAIQAYELKEKNKPTKNTDALTYYKNAVEKELDMYCHEILNLIENTLLKKTANTEAKVFYYKMRGDYNRYIAEYSSQKGAEKAISQAQQSYQTAIELMDKDKFAKTNLLRLGVSLNYSVFSYEILSDVSKACALAKKVFEDAVTEVDELEDDQLKDVTTILQLIKDNLTNWSLELPEDDPNALKK